MKDKHQFTLSEFKLLKSQISIRPLHITIASESMSPWIRVGQQIILSKCEYKNIQPFDIIVFFQNDKLICHIIYKKFDDHFISKGLNTYKFDEPINPENILGKVDHLQFGKFRRWVLKREFRKIEKKLAGAEGFEPPTY